MSNYKYDRPEQNQQYKAEPQLNTKEEQSKLMTWIWKLDNLLGGFGKQWLENKVEKTALENELLKAQINQTQTQTYNTAVETERALFDMQKIADGASRIEQEKLPTGEIEISSEEQQIRDMEEMKERIEFLRLKYGLELSIKQNQKSLGTGESSEVGKQ